jgi:hypothetical protein
VSDPERLLHIYLTDHLAVAAGAHALAKRCMTRNHRNPLGDYLERRLIPELEEEHAALLGLMRSLEAPEARLKQILARLAVQAGRAKLNGRTMSYSPLSRLEELDGLCVLVESKLLLWRTLRRVAAKQGGLRGVSLDALVDAAKRQRSDLEAHRLDAAALAFRLPP